MNGYIWARFWTCVHFSFSKWSSFLLLWLTSISDWLNICQNYVCVFLFTLKLFLGEEIENWIKGIHTKYISAIYFYNLFWEKALLSCPTAQIGLSRVISPASVLQCWDYSCVLPIQVFFFFAFFCLLVCCEMRFWTQHVALGILKFTNLLSHLPSYSDYRHVSLSAPGSFLMKGLRLNSSVLIFTIIEVKTGTKWQQWPVFGVPVRW